MGISRSRDNTETGGFRPASVRWTPTAAWLSHGLALSTLGTAVYPSQRISEGHSCQSLGTEFSMTWSRLLPNSFATGSG